MGEAKRRRELAKARAEIGEEELERRRILNGKMRQAYGIPGDGGIGDECQMCNRPFKEIEITITGYRGGKPYDVGVCCWDNIETIVAIGLYISGPNVPKDKLKAVLDMIKGLQRDGILKSDIEGHA